MPDITKIDKNLAVQSDNADDTVYYDVTKEPFGIFGVMKPAGDSDKFRRMPTDIAKRVNEGVKMLHSNTAGGRIRFRTDSPYISIKVQMPSVCRFPHMPLTGTSGFDIYRVSSGEQIYLSSFVPPYEMSDGYTSVCGTGDRDCETDYIINMPLYNDVSKLFVGIKRGSSLKKSVSEYKPGLPIVYYGSSITQGGCASRPGNCYQNIISREINRDYVNLGFSGSAMAEQEMIDYIKKLDMSVFVYDYDHNAPTAEYLEKTHKHMFNEIRAEKPDLPIIMLSRPSAVVYPDTRRRLDIIRNTYEFAIKNGDKNVYMIDGGEMMRKFCGNEGTVDNTHPNDLGFAAMAKEIGGIIKKLM